MRFLTIGVFELGPVTMAYAKGQFGFTLAAGSITEVAVSWYWPTAGSISTST